MRSRAQKLACLAFAAALCACSADSDNDNGAAQRGGSSGNAGHAGTLANPGGSGSSAGSSGSAGQGGALGNVDLDQDGFTVAEGDCADDSPQRNPGAFDFPGNGDDEDCSGSDASAGELACDDGLALDSTNPMDGARAIGLCKLATEDSRKWGVLSARYVQADGAGSQVDARQIGLLPKLGTLAARAGTKMLALSSGVARAPDQAGYTDDCDLFSVAPSAPPLGYPKQSPACPDAPSGDVFDAAALELRLRVPSNAKSLSFDSNFFTYEYPTYVCQQFNDFFVAMLDPRPATLSDGNILFDQDGNPVSVNNSLLQVCEPGMHGGKTFACPQGTAALAGTGFDGTAACGTEVPQGFPGLFGGGLFGAGGSDAGAITGAGAATGWLHTSAPVMAGTIVTLRFAIWDSGDPTLDSLALVDHFEWSIEQPVKIETTPVRPD